VVIIDDNSDTKLVNKTNILTIISSENACTHWSSVIKNVIRELGNGINGVIGNVIKVYMRYVVFKI